MSWQISGSTAAPPYGSYGAARASLAGSTAGTPSSLPSSRIVSASGPSGSTSVPIPGSRIVSANGPSAMASASDWKRSMIQPGSTIGAPLTPSLRQQLDTTPQGSFSSASTRAPLYAEAATGGASTISTPSSLNWQSHALSSSAASQQQRPGSISLASSMRPASPPYSVTSASGSLGQGPPVTASAASRATGSISAVPAGTIREEQVKPARPPPPPTDTISQQAATESASGSQPSGRPARKQKTASAEPQLLIIRASYLSGLKAPAWWEKPSSYMLSVHCGQEARNDPPPQPGRYCTASVQAKSPQVVGAEDRELRQRVSNAISTMMGDTAGGDSSSTSSPAGSGHECRFNAWIIVRLSEAGPGPAHGGPSYFRVDVWVWRTGVMAWQPQREFFGQVFVPLHNPEWQRRPCTWPVVDALGNDLAYLTCEFAFAHAPDAVRSLQVECTAPTEVSVTWKAPLMHDEAAPIHGYQVETCPLRRAQASVEAPPNSAWDLVANVPVEDECYALVSGLRGDMRYRVRVTAVNEAGTGDAAEAEVSTGPAAPCACGPPRLSGCDGVVLTVEWDAPADNGGAPLVGYWLWVKPYSTMYNSDQEPWQERGHIRHNDEGGPQRADIHTEDLNPSVDRYLCIVAAVNAAGEVGPPTQDAKALPLPNPCHYQSTPSTQAHLSFLAPSSRKLQPSISMIDYTPGNGPSEMSNQHHMGKDSGTNGFGHPASMQEAWTDDSMSHIGLQSGMPYFQQIGAYNQEEIEDALLGSDPAYALNGDLFLRSAPEHVMAEDVVQRSAPAHASDLQTEDRRFLGRP